MAAAVIGQGCPAPAQRSMGLRSVGQPIGSGIGLSWLLAGAGGFGALGVSRRPKRRWIRRSGGGCPPVRCAKQGHGGWDEEAADQGGADEDGGGQSDAQLFGAEICPKREPEEMRSSPAWRQR